MGRVDLYPTTVLQGPPSAQLGYAEITANQSGITTVTDITGLSVTITVPAGRRIKISTDVGVSSTVVTDGVDVQINEGATVLQDRATKLDANSEVAVHTEVIVTPSAGTHTYKIRVSRFAGTGSVTVAAASNKPAFINVEDITGTLWNGSLVTAGMIASEQWTDWVPTWTNLTVGNGVTIAKYQKFGRTVDFRLKFTLGTTSSVATGPIFSLPVAAAADYNQEWPLGTAVGLDSGVKAWILVCQFNSTTQGLIRTDDGAGGFGNVTATAPFTWGTADNFMIMGSYEALT